MTKKLVDETVEQFLLRGEKEERFLITDVATHGCSGGTISELIYYNDNVQFYDDHEDEIWDELSNMADDLGETIPFMISNFRGCKNVSDPKTFKNLLVWWICEHIATRISDEREDGSRKMDAFDQIDHLEKRALLDAQMNGDE
tara:strand:- start:156 stop:584 length:429 start_codon:yes stop_codon:yes gene_type:complete